MLKAITYQNHLPIQPLMLSLTCPLNLINPEGVAERVGVVVVEAVFREVVALIAKPTHWMLRMMMLCLRCTLNQIQHRLHL
jgi:hypothetical protein